MHYCYLDSNMDGGGWYAAETEGAAIDAAKAALAAIREDVGPRYAHLHKLGGTSAQGPADDRTLVNFGGKWIPVSELRKEGVPESAPIVGMTVTTNWGYGGSVTLRATGERKAVKTAGWMGTGAGEGDYFEYEVVAPAVNVFVGGGDTARDLKAGYSSRFVASLGTETECPQGPGVEYPDPRMD